MNKATNIAKSKGQGGSKTLSLEEERKDKISAGLLQFAKNNTDPKKIKDMAKDVADATNEIFEFLRICGVSTYVIMPEYRIYPAISTEKSFEECLLQKAEDKYDQYFFLNTNCELHEDIGCGDNQGVYLDAKNTIYVYNRKFRYAGDAARHLVINELLHKKMACLNLNELDWYNHSHTAIRESNKENA